MNAERIQCYHQLSSVLRQRTLALLRDRAAAFHEATPLPPRPKAATPVRLLWILGFLQQSRVTTAARIKYMYGIAKRTYYRDIARLREAGFIIITEPDGPESLVKYGGFDETFAEAVRLGTPYARAS